MPELNQNVKWNRPRQDTASGSAANLLMRVVDAGLCGVLFVAPYFFGGRHDFGRLILVSIIAVTAAAWFIRQALLPNARWTRTAAHLVLLGGVVLLGLQIAPLPEAWISRLSPRTLELLPLWAAGGDQPAVLGPWRTISLMPHETTKSLAMLVAYALLFLVVTERIRLTSDVLRLIRWVGASAVLMAGFGLLQFFTSDGRFFWFYEHPYRTTGQALAGSFINRNHFAHFLVLGVGPLAAWLLTLQPLARTEAAKHAAAPSIGVRLRAAMVAAGLVLVLGAVLMSKSRGGAIALLVATLVVTAIYWRRRLVDGRCLYGMAVLVAAVVGMLSLYNYDEVTQRLDDFAEGSIEAMDEGQGRRKIWAANLAAIDAGWLTGTGAGTHAEIYPVYLPESIPREYTHAESGYLQVMTEDGVGGAALLVIGIGLCGAWCITCLRRADTSTEVLCAGAAVAGLAASVVHSGVDFAWYIPACMSVTIVLAACVLRLAQIARTPTKLLAGQIELPRVVWTPLAAAASLAAMWIVATYAGPGIAALHWDRYLRASTANAELGDQQIAGMIDNRPDAQQPAADEAQLNSIMLHHLEQVVAWDPRFARAQSRLAARYVAQFDLLQQQAANSLTLTQVRDAAIASRFASSGELRSWLERAFGDNAKLLFQARAAARDAVTLCPLQGEPYVFLAELCFLEGGDQRLVDAFLGQALRVRPHDGDVQFEVGKQRLMAGDLIAALGHWRECFADRGPHQQKIVYLLAGRIPADMFLAAFEPDWHTLREIWSRYRQLGRREDLDLLVSYATRAAENEMLTAEPQLAMLHWYYLSQMFADLERPSEALACLERAHQLNPRHFGVRAALANALLTAKKYDEAEPHVRWCLGRRPEHKELAAALKLIARWRLDERSAAQFTARHRLTGGGETRVE